MSLIKRLFGAKNQKPMEKPHTLESLANMFAPEDHDPHSDYNMASTISGGIDSIAQDMGSDALDKVTVTLDRDGDVSVVFMATPFKPSNDIKAFFSLKTYDKINLLKQSAGKRDDLSYMTVDIAGREILKKLREQC
jgi:hypothetical protein